MTDPRPMTLAEARLVLPPVWVVYANPADYPGKVVVRVWYGIHAEPAALCVVDSVIEARECIVEAGGCVPMMPGAGDDAVIVEAWL